MHALEAIRAKIADDFATIHTDLRGITPPAGHRWEICPSELIWFAGDVLESTRHGASIFLRRFPRNERDGCQIHIEVRLFWSENSDPRPKAGAMRAILWAQHGEPAGFRSQSLLDASPAFIREDGREALLRTVRHCIKLAFARAGHLAGAR